MRLLSCEWQKVVLVLSIRHLNVVDRVLVVNEVNFVCLTSQGVQVIIAEVFRVVVIPLPLSSFRL